MLWDACARAIAPIAVMNASLLARGGAHLPDSLTVASVSRTLCLELCFKKKKENSERRMQLKEETPYLTTLHGM